ncbi:hypothetical protein TREMEDRAFT_35758 [Tremella mesenterica DSM 1558]|uniref:uncharacterized protein n=1 Tax=Tremella mesenterica (strain ATCC 24925 / CBS 8224 / DSM 1558 / NBRC 9311 / NRRL Y-6157 / RJB 2259-6 / UBC 559-6) TaxID=578456 RepID=UPI00032BD508|nr:uncharacterized protein TREMEDRAFT_35758 [Tremella mesenterica DSM 1558]EIW65943.1 hypothetical protein TREMEDRAFT_35758 [Tremella mesenterica DSM 1558]
MDSSGSDTETLLSNGSSGEWTDIHRMDHNDQPIDVEGFLNNVRRCKSLLGVAIPLGVIVEVTGLVLSWNGGGGRGNLSTITCRAGITPTWITCANPQLLIFCLYIYTLLHPITYDPISRHIKLHRKLCTTTFFSLLLLILIHPIPSIVSIIMTHHSPPTTSTTIQIITWARRVCLLLVLVISGSMRRGPKLRTIPMKLGTGFGINEQNKDVPKIRLNGSCSPLDLAEVEEGNRVLDYGNCSLLNFIFLTYVSNLSLYITILCLMRRSMSVDKLSLSDLPELEEKIRISGQDVQISKRKALEVNEKVTNWSLLQAVWTGRIHVILFSLFLETLKTSVSFLSVVATHEIIQSFNQPFGSDKSYAYLMCWLLAAGQAVECNVRENYLLHLPIRMTLSSLLFSKILRSTDAKAMEAHNVTDDEKSSGSKGRSQVMNLLTIDTGTIASLGTHTWNLTNAIIGLVIGIYFLYSMLGISAFVGILCIPLSTPASYYVARQIYKCDKKLSRATDARTGAFKELLLGIKVIKLNALEPFYKRRITHLRENEIHLQRWRFTLGTLFNVLADQLPILAISITFVFYTKVMGNRLDAATAFIALTVLSSVPRVYESVLQAQVSLGRLVTYLNQPEIIVDEPSNGEEIMISDATITWPKAENVDLSEVFKLSNVNLQLPTGKLTLICGPLGSGKTLLLRALLGETTIESGFVHAPRTSPDATPLPGDDVSRRWTTDLWLTNSVAYAPQQSYIRHGTIRDNILFGQPMWRERYDEVLRQVSLLPDLEILPERDLTEVGDYGVNLSGGQKARINLARCIYSRAKTIYLDDILSAVDAHTSQYILKECFQGSIVRNRTVVLVTHHVNLCLPASEYFISLKDGEIEQACPSNQVNISNLILLPDEPKPSDSVNSMKITKTMDEPNRIRQVYKTEHRAIGRVSASHYWLVFSAAGGPFYWFLLLLLLVMTRLSDVLQAIVLERWSADPDPNHLDWNLELYVGVVTLGVVFGGLRWIWLYGIKSVGFTSRASRVIHEKLLKRLLNAPLGWYEGTPGGRIMNVVGQDVWNIDACTPDGFGRTVMVALEISSAFIIVCAQAPSLVVFIVALGVPLYFLSGILNKLRADLRRLTATASSPTITIYHDAIDGVIMIRAFGAVELMKSTMLALINRERKTTLVDFAAIILTITSIVVSATGFVLIGQHLTSSKAGFILSFAMSASHGLFGLLEQYSGLERNFVHAERVNQYVQLPEQEPLGGQIPPQTWPSEGKIEIQELSVRYAPDLPEVLHDVSLTIEPGMRVGLVGATGSGKSTLALSLFRGIEPHNGRILVDGLDIGNLELHELRRRLNMVVQDGTLSSGTLRDALDISGEKDDREIYEALRRVHLLRETTDKDLLQDNPFANLDTFVALEGANFSQGQRQLLCLAKALLKKSKILVMDEATSSVDFEMDAKITQTIKECFAETTMLVIAHRLATIMNYDRVAVLDKGRVLEYGRPTDLMRDSTSAFAALCMAQGEEEFSRLSTMANL